MANTRVVDAAGRPVELGRLLGTGGQGSVYEVANGPGRVAKIYHRPADTELADRLRFMAANTVPELTTFTAWPLTTLHARPGGPVQGFVMPLIGGKEIHALYGVNHRRKEFPTADWRFLVHAAMNCAIAFDAIHRARFVVADVNQKNVVISLQARVGVLDCDSFQMSANGRLFRCEVGVVEYTPPELQGRSFKGVVRTPNHDLFGLAVHVFHLLFMGRHPFMGTFRGGDKSLQDAIGECRFVYGRNAGKAGMQAPPHSVPLALVPPDVGAMFETAFSSEVTRGGRPTARDWQTALTGLLEKLKQCPIERSHTFASHLGSCPWCVVVSTGGPLFFISIMVGGLEFVCGVNELNTVWRLVDEASERAFGRLAVPSVTFTGRPLRHRSLWDGLG
jgi:DNA-binding helix-hairpin-helix protein with protein kinase domain